MTKEDLIERTRLIRKDVLKISQLELAEAVGTSQVMISRMEGEGRVSADLIIDILNYYEKQGIKPHLLFLPFFDSKMLLEDSRNNHTSEICNDVEEMKKDLDKIAAKVRKIL
jgi:transcriptional regulator with XRE-family HTH domain